MKKIISLFLIITVAICSTLTVYATTNKKYSASKNSAKKKITAPIHVGICNISEKKGFIIVKVNGANYADRTIIYISKNSKFKNAKQIVVKKQTRKCSKISIKLKKYFNKPKGGTMYYIRTRAYNINKSKKLWNKMSPTLDYYYWG